MVQSLNRKQNSSNKSNSLDGIQDTKVLSYLKNLLEKAEEKFKSNGETTPNVFLGRVQLEVDKSNERAKEQGKNMHVRVDMEKVNDKGVRDLVFNVNGKKTSTFFIQHRLGENFAQKLRFRPDMVAKKAQNSPKGEKLNESQAEYSQVKPQQQKALGREDEPFPSFDEDKPTSQQQPRSNEADEIPLEFLDNDDEPFPSFDEDKPISQQQPRSNEADEIPLEFLDNEDEPFPSLDEDKPISQQQPSIETESSEEFSDSGKTKLQQKTSRVSQMTRFLEKDLTPSLDELSNALKQLEYAAPYNPANNAVLIETVSNAIKGGIEGLNEGRLEALKEKDRANADLYKGNQNLNKSVQNKYQHLRHLQNNLPPERTSVEIEEESLISTEDAPDVQMRENVRLSREATKDFEAPIPEAIDYDPPNIEVDVLEEEDILEDEVYQPDAIEKLLKSDRTIGEKIDALEEVMEQQTELLLAQKELLEQINVKLDRQIAQLEAKMPVRDENEVNDRLKSTLLQKDPKEVNEVLEENYYQVTAHELDRLEITDIELGHVAFSAQQFDDNWEFESQLDEDSKRIFLEQISALKDVDKSVELDTETPTQSKSSLHKNSKTQEKDVLELELS